MKKAATVSPGRLGGGVGQPALVRGAGRQNSGLYYVTHVTHRISQDGYQQAFRGWRNAVGLTGAEVFVDPLAAAG